jgi:hypothetical protein
VSPAPSSEVVGLLGLSEVAQVVDGEASFPLGILYPYTKALRRVCSSYDSLCRDFPDTPSLLASGKAAHVQSPGPDGRASAVAGFLASVASLQSQIAFAPGPAGSSVAAAYRRTRELLAPTGRRPRH